MGTEDIITAHTLRRTYADQRGYQAECRCGWMSDFQVVKDEAFRAYTVHVTALIDAQTPEIADDGEPIDTPVDLSVDAMRSVVSAARQAWASENERRELAVLGPRRVTATRNADIVARRTWRDMDNLHDAIVSLDAVRAVIRTNDEEEL